MFNFLNKEIVDDGEVEDPNTEIAYSDAAKLNQTLKLKRLQKNSVLLISEEERTFVKTKFNITNIKFEKDHIYKKYKERVGEIITGEVYQVWKKKFW